MPTGRAELSRSPFLGGLLALTLVVGGCSSADDRAARTAPEVTQPGASGGPVDPDGVDPDDVRGSPPAVEGLPVPPDLDAAFTELLDTRAQALRLGDREAFLSVLDQRDDGFLVAQEGYFDNLAQLPLATFSYDLDPASLVRGRRSYSVVVEVALQLDGFDAVPVRTLDRFRFDQVGTQRSGRAPRFRLSSVTDRAWEEANDIPSQPWERRPIQVRRGAGVLAVFDDASVADAGPLLRGLERSVSDVAARLPYPWDATVVVYALSDTDFIRSLDDLPGEDPDELDGIAFTVPAGPGDPTIAATRIALNPRISTRSGLVRQRLLRHELTHVAVGERDDNAPAWLSEGLAEWVSVQALPERKRRIGTDALGAAQRGVEEMPVDETFNDVDAPLHYAVSWWACEYLATTYGDSAPWTVLDAFAPADVPERPTIRALLQIGVDQLARRATKLLVRTYAPDGRSGQGRSGRDRSNGSLEPGDRTG